MTLLDKLLFVPSMLLTIMSDDNWYDRIDNCVIIGALPFRSTIDKLIAEHNIKGILSMNQKFEINSLWYPTANEMQSKGVAFMQLPVEDYVGHATWTQAQQGLNFIDRFCAINGTVYVHCKAGKYRSALMTATYLMHKYNITPIEAESRLKSHRKQIWLHDAETAVLQTFYDRLNPGQSRLTTPETIRM
ncbi:putative Phosphatidylglycerophosphatase and protein-tyrosine phosphatase 1 [Hypsibius exemplaris]|uniref:Phosphatidylglycerophosphatase and protein-tyrosine phosphatase 1 n=1 Tax=Hypsibius exemplaris TaxID=2072580 RepID=A0A1W0XE84_HYPEX|nr:putative Phosphatidylglycerophosphatase and protein-tyrosine phosphatase 1 [Hypsibius exemplaris]